MGRCTCVTVRVQMPERLVTAVRTLVGTSRFGEYFTEAVDSRHRHDLVAEWIEEFEVEHGPVDEELLSQAASEWPDYEDDQDSG